MTKSTFTFRVDEELKNDFTDTAKALDRTGAQLLRGFMRDVVDSQQSTDKEYDEWFRREVQIGLDSANAGRLIPNDVVEAKFAALRAKTRRMLNNQ